MNFFKTLFGGKSENLNRNEKDDKLKNFDILKCDGVRAIRMNKPDYAIQCFIHALQIKDDLEIHDYMSQAYLQSDNALKAYEQLQILADVEPENINILLRMANVALLMQDYDAMTAACEKSLLIDDKSVEALWLYAKACIQQGDLSNGIAMLTKALQIKSDFTEALLLRASAFYSDGNLSSADEDATLLLKENSVNEDALLIKARIEHARENDEEAITYYNKVLEVNPFSIDAYQEIGNIKQNKGDTLGANEAFSMSEELRNQQSLDNENEASERIRNAYKSADIYGAFSNIIDNS